MCWSFHTLADKASNEHFPKPFFKVIRKSFYSPLRFAFQNVCRYIAKNFWMMVSIYVICKVTQNVLLELSPIGQLAIIMNLKMESRWHRNVVRSYPRYFLLLSVLLNFCLLKHYFPANFRCRVMKRRLASVLCLVSRLFRLFLLFP